MSSGGIRTSVEDLLEIYFFVHRYPGVRRSVIASSLGVSYWKISNRLMAMERVGLLLSEDIKGRLYPYSCRGYYDH